MHYHLTLKLKSGQDIDTFKCQSFIHGRKDMVRVCFNTNLMRFSISLVNFEGAVLREFDFLNNTHVMLQNFVRTSIQYNSFDANSSNFLFTGDSHQFSEMKVKITFEPNEQSYLLYTKHYPMYMLFNKKSYSYNDDIHHTSYGFSCPMVNGQEYVIPFANNVIYQGPEVVKDKIATGNDYLFTNRGANFSPRDVVYCENAERVARYVIEYNETVRNAVAWQAPTVLLHKTRRGMIKLCGAILFNKDFQELPLKEQKEVTKKLLQKDEPCKMYALHTNDYFNDFKRKYGHKLEQSPPITTPVKNPLATVLVSDQEPSIAPGFMVVSIPHTITTPSCSKLQIAKPEKTLKEFLDEQVPILPAAPDTVGEILQFLQTGAQCTSSQASEILRLP